MEEEFIKIEKSTRRQLYSRLDKELLINYGLLSLLQLVKMLTAKAELEFRKILKIGETLRISAILWRNHENRLELHAVLIYYITYLVGMSYCTANGAYLTFVMWELLSGRISSSYSSKITYRLSARMIGVIFQYYTFWFRNEIKTYCRKNFEIHKRVQRKYNTWQ